MPSQQKSTMDRPPGRTTFASDPAYQSALDAAARGSVLAATAGLGGLSLTPPPPRPPPTGARGFSTDAPTPPPPPPAARPHAAAPSPAEPAAAAAPSGDAEAGGKKAMGRTHKAPVPTARDGPSSAAAGSAAGSKAGGGGKGPTAKGGSGGFDAEAVAREAAPARHAEHLSQEELQRGLKGGQLFRGKMRVNAGDRREAYVTVPGLPHDIMVRGDACQNRAVEGDEVAVAVNPVGGWWTVNKLRDAAPRTEMDPSLASALADDDCPWRSCATPAATTQLLGRLAAARPELRITGKVAAILTPSPKREHLVGLLQLGQPQAGSGPQAGPQAGPLPPGATCYLLPLDPRLPRAVVRPSELKCLPEALIQELRAGEAAESRTLMSARVVEWSSSHCFPAVALRGSLGQAGEIESETAALLEAEDVRHGEFAPEVLACLPPTPWAIGEEERAKRRDFRSVRVFSIDPPTAKDLDDALSIQPLPLPGGRNGWRVGVHIADVAHFIEPFSALDVEAGQRATSVYLVQRVVPMLPPLLCEELCSLNPGVERLAFSVVWDMDEQGTIQSTWFGRSVIRSCAKLSYPLVQAMIEGRFDPATVPPQARLDPASGATWEEVIGDSLHLWSLAQRLRSRRYAGGALRLDGVRLCYALDRDGNPASAAPYVQQEANQLVEEFMLLANRSVAELISATFADRAMLRRHPAPNAAKLKVLQDVAEAAGMPFDVSSAAAIQSGLDKLRAAVRAAAQGGGGTADGQAGAGGAEAGAAEGEGGEVGAALGNDPDRARRTLELLVMLATRPMQLAEYFSTGALEDPSLWRHYALAVRAYTHFTSPIRRYPDVVVHRLLAAALEARGGDPLVPGNILEGGAGQGGGAEPQAAEEAAAKHRLLDTRLTALVAEHCNDRRLAARNAQDGSLRLYLCVLLRRHPVIALATVSNVGGDRYFGAYLTEYGHEIRIELSEAGVPLHAAWNPGAKVLTLTRGAEGDQGQGGGGGGGNRGGRGGGGGFGGGMGRRGHGAPAGRGGNGHGNRNGNGNNGNGNGNGGVDVPDLAPWVESLAPVRNPHGLAPCRLPLHVRLFSEVPVVLTAVMKPGQPSQLYARLYLPEAAEAIAAKAARGDGEAAAAGPDAAAAAAAAVAAGIKAEVEAEAEAEGLRPSEIAWESHLND
ncbi:hypothetical protein HYH03_003789 [Edaphochlamys debaryana]|uniref:RNB domain-containing protein n=1 Tax=Edaphochlamys debaryana TaxID=47281 RepID=A0A836C3P4_9CHLO|nr:hypothetical protein HYH03_003789 [Edaphochlamys debaryana]|eukprot:KAG2498028.1 hypothetical protein HYH03_003789 [Edaphochlamys debaryana]